MLFFTGKLFKIHFKNNFPQHINLIPLPLDIVNNPIRYIHIALIRHLVAPVYFPAPLIEYCFLQVNYLKLFLKNTFPQDINIIILPLDVGHSSIPHVHIVLICHLGPLEYFFNITI